MSALRNHPEIADSTWQGAFFADVYDTGRLCQKSYGGVQVLRTNSIAHGLYSVLQPVKSSPEPSQKTAQSQLRVPKVRIERHLKVDRSQGLEWQIPPRLRNMDEGDECTQGMS